MTARRVIVRLVVVAAAIVAAVCLCCDVQRIVDVFGRRQNAEFVDAFRAIAAEVEDARVAMPCADPSEPDPLERTKLTLLDWELSPRTVRPIAFEDVLGWEGDLVTSAFMSDCRKDFFVAAGCVRKAENGFAMVWHRGDYEPRCREEVAGRVHPSGGIREWIGALMTMQLIFLLWWGLRTGPFRFSPWKLLGALTVFAVLSAVALEIGLSAPNGFAVYAGKAKLILSVGGIPLGFWSDPAFAVYQPAYPPGMVMPPLVAYACFGGAAEHGVQLFVPLIMTLLFLEMNARAACVDTRAVVTLLMTISPLAMQLASGFAAEPLAALVLLMGWNAISFGRTYRGWSLIGCVALIRPEGLVLALSVWLAAAICARVRSECAGFPCGGWRGLAITLLPGLCWAVLAAMNGAFVQGFDFLSVPSIAQMIAVAVGFVSEMFVNPFRVGAPWLFVIATGIIRAFPYGRESNWRSVRVAGLSVLLAMGACIVLLGFCVSGHFEWMIANTLSRFLWLSSLPFVYEMTSTDSANRFESASLNRG